MSRQALKVSNFKMPLRILCLCICEKKKIKSTVFAIDFSSRKYAGMVPIFHYIFKNRASDNVG